MGIPGLILSTAYLIYLILIPNNKKKYNSRLRGAVHHPEKRKPCPSEQGAGCSSPTLARIARRRAFFPPEAEDVGGAFEAILEELSNQYLLTYVPPSAARDGRWHRIRVEIPGQRYQVRARQGYRMVAAR